jgi:Domain of unknown function (DUF4410)
MNPKSTQFPITLAIASAMAVLTLSGCATIGGKPTFTHSLAADARVISGDKVRSEVTAGPQVTIASYERERFAQKIDSVIRGRAQPGHRAGRNYRIVVNLTKYKKGNAFARAMMAGLGSIRIEANVSLYSMPGKKLEGQFTMEKTFTWGGIYGGVTNIEDVEEEFAKSLAEAVCTPKAR